MSAHVEPIVDTDELRDHIRAMYREVAEQPDGDFHFELGRPVAERLGYPREWLDAVPPDALASFAGVGHMLDLAAIEPGDTVLDLGSGSGTDAFVAAHLTGPTGRVIGVDMTDAQLAKARRLRGGLGLEHVQFVEGLIEAPPVDAQSVDVVISNGVVNLAPDKGAVFAAAARALRPGGRPGHRRHRQRPRADRAHAAQRRAVGGLHRRGRPAGGLPRRHRGGRAARGDRARQRLRLPLAAGPGGGREVRRDERDGARHQAGGRPGLVMSMLAVPVAGGDTRHVPPRVSSPQFVGRAAELEILEAMLARAESGVAGAVFVCGESGIGKTRLLRELEGRAGDRGARVMRGECPAFGAGELAYAPIASALRRLEREFEPEAFAALVGPARDELARLVPEWGAGAAPSDPAAPGDAFVQARLFGILRGLLDRLAADAPLVFAVEDLHWADRSTLELLSSLLRGLRDERVLLVCSYRSDELHRRHPLRPFVAEEERRAGVQRFELEPFSPAELAAQVAGILGDAADPGMVARLHARCEGNAFFAEELLAASGGAAGPLPPTLREVLDLRLEALPPDARMRVARRRGRRRPGGPSAARRRSPRCPRRRCSRRCARRSPITSSSTTATATPSAMPCSKRRPTPICSPASGPPCTWRSPRP